MSALTIKGVGSHASLAKIVSGGGPDVASPSSACRDLLPRARSSRELLLPTREVGTELVEADKLATLLLVTLLLSTPEVPLALSAMVALGVPLALSADDAATEPDEDAVPRALLVADGTTEAAADSEAVGDSEAVSDTVAVGV